MIQLSSSFCGSGFCWRAQKITIGSYEKNPASTRLYHAAGYRLNGYRIEFERTPSVADDMAAERSSVPF